MSIKFIILIVLILLAAEMVVLFAVSTNDMIRKIAGVLFRQKKYKPATKIYEFLSNKKNNSSEDGFNLAMSYFRMEDYENAKTTFIKFLQKNPDSYEALYNLGLIYLINNDIFSAKNYFKKALALKQNDVDSLYQLGVITFNLKETEEALKYFEKAKVIQSDKVDFKYCILRCKDTLCTYNNEEEIEEILGEYEGFISQKSLLTDFFVESSYVQALAKAGKTDKVIEAAMDLLSKSKNQEYILYKLLGLAYFVKQDYVNALKNFTESQKSACENAEIYNIIAHYYYLRNDNEKFQNFQQLSEDISKKMPQMVYL